MASPQSSSPDFFYKLARFAPRHERLRTKLS